MSSSIDTSERRPGDLGVYRDKTTENEKSEIHAFIYISDNLSFSKRNPSYLNPYEIVSSSVDFKRAQTAEIEKGNSGDLSSQFLRCQSIDRYLNEHQNEISKDFLTSHAILKAQECEQHRFLIGQSPINTASADVFRAIGKLAIQKLDTSDSSKMGDQERFLWKAALFRSQLGLKQAGTDFLMRSPNIGRMPLYQERKRRESSIKFNLFELLSVDSNRLQEK